jgi:Phage capsid family
MANQIPLRESPLSAGGYLLPVEQGEMLTNGILSEAGAIALAGDKRATGATKTQFTIWLGTPTAGFVGEGAPKPVTGAEFGQTVMDVKKVASIVLFTDEMIEDVQSGDLNVLVDSGVRQAIEKVIDAHAIGMEAGTAITTAFNNALAGSTLIQEYDQTKPDGLQLAVSGAMGKLEANGYPDNLGLLIGTGWRQAIRDARSSVDPAVEVYGPGRDPTYGLETFYSTNLSPASAAPGIGNVVGFVAYRPNLHVRVRKDVTVATSTEATVNDGTTDRKLFQEDLTAVRYETRQAFMVHDLNRAVVKIINAA